MEDKFYGSSEFPDAFFFAFDFHALENWEGKGKHANRNRWIMHQSVQVARKDRLTRGQMYNIKRVSGNWNLPRNIAILSVTLALSADC